MSNCYNASMKISKKIDNAKNVYLSFSGGKDSTAMLLHLKIGDFTQTKLTEGF